MAPVALAFVAKNTSLMAGLPVVPVSVTGSRHVMRRGWLMTCPGQVKLTLHRPIATTGLSRDDAADLAERVQRIVETAVDCDGPDGGEAPE